MTPSITHVTLSPGPDVPGCSWSRHLPGRHLLCRVSRLPLCPLRPVLSATNTAEYSLAKWLEGEIKPFLVDKWSVASSEIFVEELNLIKPSKDDICVSFDVKSLFTMVPLQEVIADVTRVVYDEESSSILLYLAYF